MTPIIITALFGALVNSVEPPAENLIARPADTSFKVTGGHDSGNSAPEFGLKVVANSNNEPLRTGLNQWEIHPNDVRLDVAFKRWSDKAGYSFRWDADRYVLVSAQTVLKGTFESAVNTVLKSPGIRLSDYPLEACIYANEPPLLRVTRLGDQAKECQP